jgi:hypothetical protein
LFYIFLNLWTAFPIILRKGSDIPLPGYGVADKKIQGTSENPGGFSDVPRITRFFAAVPNWRRKKCAQIHKMNMQLECRQAARLYQVNTI